FYFRMTRTEYADLEVMIEVPVARRDHAREIARENAAGFIKTRNFVAPSDVMVDWPERLIPPVNEHAPDTLIAVTSEPEFSKPEFSEPEMKGAAEQIWRMVLETVRPQISAQTMRTWFEPLVATNLEGSEITLRAPSNFFRE